MSTKSMNLEERPEETEKPDEKNGPTLAHSLSTEISAEQKQADGKPNASQLTLNAESMGDLLARLQDILSLWPGSDNRIIGNFVMTAFPIPVGVKVDKVMTSDGKAFTVNGVPVVNAERS